MLLDSAKILARCNEMFTDCPVPKEGIEEGIKSLVMLKRLHSFFVPFEFCLKLLALLICFLFLSNQLFKIIIFHYGPGVRERAFHVFDDFLMIFVHLGFSLLVGPCYLLCIIVHYFLRRQEAICLVFCVLAALILIAETPSNCLLEYPNFEFAWKMSKNIFSWIKRTPEFLPSLKIVHFLFF